MMNKIVRCNICGVQRNTLIKKGVYGNSRQNIYRCLKCEHIYLAPLQSDQDDEKFYLSEYPIFLAKRGDFRNSSPKIHFEKNIDEARRRLKNIRHVLSKKQNILEIGSATGFFLNHIKNYVKNVCGVEPHAEYRKYALQKNIPTYADIRELPKNKFDLIFLYYVLEHVKDPVVFMQDLKHLLKGRSSKFVIEVPNVNEALLDLYKCQAYNEFVWQRAHCSYFSSKTLESMLHKIGFSTQCVPVQRYDFSNHVHWLIEGKSGGSGKYCNIFSDKLNQEYANNLKRHWLCDTILVIANLK